MIGCKIIADFHLQVWHLLSQSWSMFYNIGFGMPYVRLF